MPCTVGELAYIVAPNENLQQKHKEFTLSEDFTYTAKKEGGATRTWKNDTKKCIT